MKEGYDRQARWRADGCVSIGEVAEKKEGEGGDCPQFVASSGRVHTSAFIALHIPVRNASLHPRTLVLSVCALLGGALGAMPVATVHVCEDSGLRGVVWLLLFPSHFQLQIIMPMSS